MSVEQRIPDIGNFKDVEVVDVLVKVGDVVEVDSPLVTLETDKASMDVPATTAGRITEVLLKRGDKVSKDSLIARVESGAAAATAPAPPAPEPARPPAAAVPRAASAAEPQHTRTAQLLVLGSGPGGYTAAFRAADLGLKVTLVERDEQLGGVCLNVGCIPSKALLHAAKVIEEAEEMGSRGIQFGKPQVERAKLRAWKSSVVGKLTGGLKVLARQRKVEVLRGSGRFVSPNVLEVAGATGTERVRFEQCIIAAGSEPVRLPNLPDDPRVIDSTGALELPEFGGPLLVIGGGIIGLEMACVYDAIGTQVSVVELTAQLMPGCDPDLVRPLEKRIRARYQQILLGTRVTGVEAQSGGLRVSFAGEKAPQPQLFERVLVAVGRVPNGRAIGAELAGVKVSERGFVPVDRQMRTNVPHIFAIGDIAAPPLLA
ncbi:MAG: dihydrolipoyl dehydrogenase, partial [Gammaproteobacteria bacterium]|nr:dihydrolipoyl dehydrogenase [Gammaproteobacteria bacterium]